jgi:putative aldouronate transport system permease protein
MIMTSFISTAGLSGKVRRKAIISVTLQPLLTSRSPVLAALSVFTAVGVWNDYGATLYFTQSSDLQTLQYLILRLIQPNTAVEQLASTAAGLNPAVSELFAKAQGQELATAQTIELAAMVIASIPMIVMYPFA